MRLNEQLAQDVHETGAAFMLDDLDQRFRRSGANRRMASTVEVTTSRRSSPGSGGGSGNGMPGGPAQRNWRKRKPCG